MKSSTGGKIRLEIYVAYSIRFAAAICSATTAETKAIVSKILRLLIHCLVWLEEGEQVLHYLFPFFMGAVRYHHAAGSCPYKGLDVLFLRSEIF